MGGLHAKSMTSQRNRAVTRWRICVNMATLFYIFNSTVIDWTCYIYFFFMWKWGEMFRSTGCWVPWYSFQIRDPLDLSHSFSPKSTLFLNSSVLTIHISHALCSVILVHNFPLTKQCFLASLAALGLHTAVVYIIPSLYLCHLFPCHWTLYPDCGHQLSLLNCTVSHATGSRSVIPVVYIKFTID